MIRKTNGTLAAQNITAEEKKDKIAALRQAVGEGTYQVKASETAAKIIDKFFFQLLAGRNRHAEKLKGAPFLGPPLETTSQPQMINSDLNRPSDRTGGKQ